MLFKFHSIMDDGMKIFHSNCAARVEYYRRAQNMADIVVTECKKTLRGRLCLQKNVTSEGDYFNEEIEENLR